MCEGLSGVRHPEVQTLLAYFGQIQSHSLLTPHSPTHYSLNHSYMTKRPISGKGRVSTVILDYWLDHSTQAILSFVPSVLPAEARSLTRQILIKYREGKSIAEACGGMASPALSSPERKVRLTPSLLSPNAADATYSLASPRFY